MPREAGGAGGRWGGRMGRWWSSWLRPTPPSASPAYPPTRPTALTGHNSGAAMMRPRVGTAQTSSTAAAARPATISTRSITLERRLRAALGVPPADELRLPPERPRVARRHRRGQRRHLRHECRKRPILLIAQLEPPGHHVLDSPFACNRSRSLRLARNSSTLMLRFPTPSEAAISSWLSPSTYASHSSARSREVSLANVRATSSIARVGQRRRPRLGRGAARQSARPAPLPSPPSIDEQVARHAVEEAPALLGVVGVRAGAQQPEERLLHDVVGIRAVAGDPIHVSPERPRVAPVKGAERRFVELRHPYATSAGPRVLCPVFAGAPAASTSDTTRRRPRAVPTPKRAAHRGDHRDRVFAFKRKRPRSPCRRTAPRPTPAAPGPPGAPAESARADRRRPCAGDSDSQEPAPPSLLRNAPSSCATQRDRAASAGLARQPGAVARRGSSRARRRRSMPSTPKTLVIATIAINI